MDHTICSLCQDIDDNNYYPHDHDEIYSPFFKKMIPIGVKPGDKDYHAHFLKCPQCGTYYSYENWQQGIGNIGEFDQIDRFTDIENEIIKPILEADNGKYLIKHIEGGIEHGNGIIAEKTQIAFECVMNILPFPETFPVIRHFLSYSKTWSTINGKPIMQGRYWACYCLRYLIRTGKALPSPEVDEAIQDCFKLKIEYENGWKDPSDMPIL